MPKADREITEPWELSAFEMDEAYAHGNSEDFDLGNVAKTAQSKLLRHIMTFPCPHHDTSEGTQYAKHNCEQCLKDIQEHIANQP